jgi:CRISPR type III-A-associated protein Csm2
MAYDSRQDRRSFQGAAPRGQPPTPPPSQPPIKIKEIVEHDNPVLLVDEAQKLAVRLRGEQGEATKTQIRRLFSTMRQIEMQWQQNEARAYRQLVLLQPRLVYQTSKNDNLRPLSDTLQIGIQAVGQSQERLERLVQFFEATLAYWIGH